MFLVFLFSTVFGSKNHIITLSRVVSGVHSDIRKTISPLSLFLFTLILFLISINLIGLAPYVYGITRNLWTAGSLALLLWGLLLASGWQNNPAASAAHLAPAGAPGALVPFLVLIETVRVLIRPLTLTVRLIANIRAGHIILSLVANCLTRVSGLSFLFMLILNTGYNIFEVFVCVIQAYIFSLLIKLYAEEHP